MLEIKNTVIEIKNAFDEIISTLDIAEERISELEGYINRIKKQREQRLEKKPEKSIQGLWDNYKRCNIHLIGVSEGEEKGKGTEEIFERIMTKNYHKLMSDTRAGSTENTKQD